MLAAFAVTGVSTEKFFAASLNLGISATAISYLGIFPALFLLRRSHPDVVRPYRVPFGDRGALVVTVASPSAGAPRHRVPLVARPRPARRQRRRAPRGLRDLGRARRRRDLPAPPVRAHPSSSPLALFVAVGVVFLLLGRREKNADRRAVATAHLVRARG